MLRSSPIQQTIDFEIHELENNSFSQVNLEENKAHFIKSAKKVYDRLMSGEMLTVLIAINSGISSLPRRIADLRYGKQKKGPDRKERVKISELTVKEEGKPAYKIWFCTKEDVEYNNKHFK